VFDKDHIN